jgi:serine/threonine protein phosphatase PrpC
MYSVTAIYPPIGFSERGRRDNNEDYVLPAPGKAGLNDRLFIVCDGVGGAQRGELASLLAGEAMFRYFKNHPAEAVTAPFVRSALLTVEEAFDEAIASEPEANLAGMSTTLTVLSLHEQGVTIGHIGDSRVYHIRGEQVLHQTTDHSLVNELVRAKQITPEEALSHPRRNVITRAIQGSGRPSSITVYITQDVAPGDYFFLCTDGVLECLNNEALLRILSTHTLTDSQKVSHILRACTDGSRDNFSGYLIRVADVIPLAPLPDPADELPPASEHVPKPAAPHVAPTTDVPAPASVPETSNEFSLLLDDPTPRERGWLQRLFS